MRQFSFGNAWSQGLRFFSPQAANHIIIILGVGVVAPILLQYMLAGGPTSLANPALMGGSMLNPSSFASIAGFVLLAAFIGYVCNFGALFGSLRLGFAPGETVGGAVVYGAITAVVIAFGMIVALGVPIFIGAQSGGEATGLVLVLIILTAFMLFFAVLFPVFMTMFCLLMILALLIVLGTGASLPQGQAQTFTGAVLFVSLAIVLLLFWATARLSCTTAAMAARGTYNPLVGIADSWRLTAGNQWRILGYLSLLAFILFIGFIILALVLGANLQPGMQAAAPAAPGAGDWIAAIVMGALFLYFSVLVPAGIYRELVPSVSAAEAFR